MYATVTSKGQITLPAAARRELGIHSGQRLAIQVERGSLVIDAPKSVSAMRSLLKQEMETARTTGLVPTAGDGWAARAEDYRADR